MKRLWKSGDVPARAAYGLKMRDHNPTFPLKGSFEGEIGPYQGYIRTFLVWVAVKELNLN